MKDATTISNAQHEIKQAAKTLGVHPIVIHLAKHYSGSNDRAVIYDWVEKRRGTDIVVSVQSK